MKKLLKWGCTALGILIFIFCITDEIDGVGRFACVLFATLFSIIGSALKGDESGHNPEKKAGR